MRFTFIIFLGIFAQSLCVRRVAEIDGDINVAVLLKNCPNSNDSIPFNVQSILSSTLWITKRINYLELLAPLRLGVEIYEVCNETEYFDTIFEVYQKRDRQLVGLISSEKINENVLKFCEVLNIRIIRTSTYESFFVKAGIQFINALGWVENITVFAPEEHILDEFFSYSRKEFICVKECMIYGSTCHVTINSSQPFIFFGEKHHIEEFIQYQNLSENELNGLFVPVDGSVPLGLPDGSFVVIPPHDPPSRNYKDVEKLLPSPTFFEITKPILSYVDNIQTFLSTKCNNTPAILDCLKTFHKYPHNPSLISVVTILEILEISSLKSSFIYNIYQVDTNISNSAVFEKNNVFQPYNKIFEYNIFWNNITLLDQSFEPELYNSSGSNGTKRCLSIYSHQNVHYIFRDNLSVINFRSEAWVYAFLSLSLLGVIFCVSILIFILICIFRRDIIEGNPVLTLALLLAVMLLFCGVLPFSIENNKYTINTLCLLKSLGITLGYALVFALLLSRCILLATASKEIGFMSHIAGPVQSFLCLFILGVQAALSLQVFDRGSNVFKGQTFVYLMSYNTMLLLLLLCLCPLIYKCQRNYREGKYFTIAIVLTTCVWSVWLPLYMVLTEDYREIILCTGLVATAGIFLGAVFIPRTYLMTSAAAREKLTSTFPSLATATSAMDIYRANNQSLYDCVNIAAINAATVARAGVTPPASQQPDLYSCPALPDDEDFDFRCDTPTSTDKVTRF